MRMIHNISVDMGNYGRGLGKVDAVSSQNILLKIRQNTRELSIKMSRWSQCWIEEENEEKLTIFNATGCEFAIYWKITYFFEWYIDKLIILYYSVGQRSKMNVLPLSDDNTHNPSQIILTK